MTRIEKLKKWRTTLVEYMLSKMEQEDWHGVADAANDIRELDAKIEELVDEQGV